VFGCVGVWVCGFLVGCWLWNFVGWWLGEGEGGEWVLLLWGVCCGGLWCVAVFLVVLGVGCWCLCLFIGLVAVSIVGLIREVRGWGWCCGFFFCGLVMVVSF